MVTKVEDGIPLPPRAHRYPLKEMKIGESFVVQIGTRNKDTVRSNIYGYAKQRSVTVAMRSIEGGIRVWKTGTIDKETTK